MSLFTVVLGSAVILAIAYISYGRLLAKLFDLDASRSTPAVELRDDIDYQPLKASSLLPQHFSAIAAAGPIVGPIVAGLVFGWLPALLWILIGSILIGGVHDFTALVASIRHKARSIAEVVNEHVSRLSYLIFLAFIWIALVYIVVAFTDVTAGSFVGAAQAANGNVPGAAIAGSSLLYLILPIVMGLVVRFCKIPMGTAVLFAIPLVVVAILVGKYVPVDIQAWFGLSSPGEARKVWSVILLIYCLVAGVVPVWLLLQPRGELGGYFLYAALAIGALGLIVGGGTIQYPAFRGWVVETPKATQSLFPFLFITIACGACSGFHSLIASGTTSKQLKKETDARVVGYGTMLLEAMVAIVSLCCVMSFAPGSTELKGDPNQIYAQGIGNFARAIGIPREAAITFALLAFTTFVYDTLDVCTRLGRFIIQELTGLHNWVGKTIGTLLTAGVPVFFMLRHPSEAPPLFQTFWSLFGASNQLLAALTLLGVTVWLWKTKGVWWVWLVVGIPTVWMYTMSVWALYLMTIPKLYSEKRPSFMADPVPYVGLVLLIMAWVMLMEAIRVIFISRPPASAVPKASALA